MIELSDEFVFEWNHGVRLYRAGQRPVIVARGERYRRITKAMYRRYASMSRDESVKKPPAGLWLRSNQRYAAARRLLSRVDARQELTILERTEAAREDRDLQRFLDRNEPIKRPAMVEFDRISRFVEVWHDCEVMHHDGGLSAVKKERDSLVDDIVQVCGGIATRQGERMSGLDLDEIGNLSNPIWCEAAVEMADGIKFVDACMLFRLSVMRQYILFARTAGGKRYPADWNYLVCISTHPLGWRTGSEQDEIERILRESRNDPFCNHIRALRNFCNTNRQSSERSKSENELFTNAAEHDAMTCTGDVAKTIRSSMNTHFSNHFERERPKTVREWLDFFDAYAG